jgi:hypothetical protein
MRSWKIFVLGAVLAAALIAAIARQSSFKFVSYVAALVATTFLMSAGTRAQQATAIRISVKAVIFN